MHSVRPTQFLLLLMLVASLAGGTPAAASQPSRRARIVYKVKRRVYNPVLARRTRERAQAKAEKKAASKERKAKRNALAKRVDNAVRSRKALNSSTRTFLKFLTVTFTLAGAGYVVSQNVSVSQELQHVGYGMLTASVLTFAGGLYRYLSDRVFYLRAYGYPRLPDGWDMRKSDTDVELSDVADDD